MAVIETDMFWEMHLQNSARKPLRDTLDHPNTALAAKRRRQSAGEICRKPSVSAFAAASMASAAENQTMPPSSSLYAYFRALPLREFRPQILSNGKSTSYTLRILS